MQPFGKGAVQSLRRACRQDCLGLRNAGGLGSTQEGRFRRNALLGYVTTCPPGKYREANFKDLVDSTMSDTAVTESMPDITFYNEHFPNQEILKKRLPWWFTRYTPDMASLQVELYKSQLQSLAAQKAFSTLIEPLKSVRAFSRPLLNNAMLEQFRVKADCTQIYLEELIAASPLEVTRSSLLSAALFNFAVNKVFLPGAVLRYIPAVYPADYSDVCGEQISCSSGQLNTEPAAFAQMCRTLDLGGKYQAHLDSVFKSETTSGQISEAFILKERLRFEVLSHIARMKYDVSAEAYEVLLKVAKDGERPVWRGGPVRYCTLEILDRRVTGGFMGGLAQGILIVESHTRRSYADPMPREELIRFGEPGHDYPVVVYMPGDPVHPLKEYGSRLHFIADLLTRFTEPSFQSYFARFIRLQYRGQFFEKMNRALEGDIFSEIAPLLMSQQGRPFQLLYNQALDTLYADAEVLAVPVAHTQHAANTGALHIFRSVAHFGFDLADVFLPASEVRDLLKDTFIALEDWSDGDTGKALDQLYAIGKDAVMLAVPKVAKEVERVEKVYEDGKQALEFLKEVLEPAVSSSGTSTAAQEGAERDKIVEIEPGNDVHQTQSTPKPSAFIESLVQVKSYDPSTRLWKPSLDSYALHGLPEGAFLDSRSLYHAGGKTYLAMGKHFYQIHLDPTLRKWCVLHPDAAPGYSPVLETNNAGAWRFEGENPMGWDAYTAFRRLHGDLAVLSDDTIQHILRVTEVDEALLRKIHVDKLFPPALLIDCTQRFLVDREVSEFIDLMWVIANFGSAEEHDQFFVARIEPYLDFLVTLPGWPGDCVLRRVDAQGTVLSIHAPTTITLRTVDVMYTPGKMKAFLDALVIKLSPEDVEMLLVDYEGPKTQGQHLALRIAYEAQGRRGVLFELLYAALNPAAAPLVQLMKRDFKTLPDTVAREIVSGANSVERSRMEEARRIPLRLAEQAREYLQQLRLNRALECFYLHIETPDSSTVALGLISSWPDWPQDQAIEVRNVNGETLSRLGGSNTTSSQPSLVLVKTDDDYQAFDGNGSPIQLKSASTHGTLASALAAQTSLADDVGQLKVALGDIATKQRSKVKRLLGMRQTKPGIIWPSRLADGRVGYPLSSRLRGLFSKFRNNAQAFSPELAVQNLYPQLTPREVRKFLQAAALGLTGTAGEKQNQIRAMLNELTEQYARLESTLDRWLSEVRLAQDGHLPDATVAGRETARTRILACWRKEPASLIDPQVPDSAHKLDLSDLSIGALPAIEANFKHVHALTLENMALTVAGVEAFLRCFPQVRWLSLRGNLLNSIPVTLGSLSTLKSLMLSNNPVTVDAEGLQSLQRLKQLETLVLEGQAITIPVAIDISQWPALVELKLRNCGLVIMLSGLGVHEPLRHVDLRHNRIIDISEQTLSAIASRPQLYVRLHLNPLSNETIERALRFFNPIRLVRMGVMTLPRLPGRNPPVSEWLAETGSQEQLLRWAELQLETGGEAFVQLVSDLFITADYRDNRRELTVRLWRMIDAMSSSYALQEELFALAAHPQTCGDGTMIIFNQLDVRVLVFELEVANGGVTPVDMFKLIRGLERLSELEKIALEDINARIANQPELDLAEVRLIYPTRLRESLELPGQARAMLFETTSGVTQQMLDQARNRVLARESTQAFFDAMIARKDWISFLEEHYPARFEQINQPFHDRQDVLDSARGTLTDEAFLRGTNEVLRDRQEACSVLASLLTQEIAQSAAAAG